MTARPSRKRKPRAPLDDVAEVPPRVRQRKRASGDWRLWWEPTSAEREAFGFEVVELDASQITWSIREAQALNRRVERARSGLTVAVRGGRTVSKLVVEYRRSPAWMKLRPATQRDYASTFLRIEAKWGATQVAAFTKPILREWYETLYRENGKWIAQHDLRIFSVVLGYGELRGWVNANPATRLKMETPQPRDRVLSWEKFDALCASAEDLGLAGMRLAIAVAWYQGQRQADVLAAAVKTTPSLRDVQFRDLRRSWAWWAREGGASDRDRADGMGNQSDKDVRLGQTYNPASQAGAGRAVEAMRRPERRGSKPRFG